MPKDALETPTPVKVLSVDERLLAILEAQQKASESQSVMAQATAKRLAPKSLEIAEISQASAFNPRGERDFPMPRLKCAVYAPWKLDPNHHSCTREEVELYNLLTPGVYAITLNDGMPAKVEVEAALNTATGVIERLLLKPDPSWSNENRQRFKPMTDMLREMLGDKADGVLTMKQEKARIALPATDPRHLSVGV